MNKEQINKIKEIFTDKTSIHCPTQKEADEFSVLLSSAGYKWGNGDELMFNTRWDIYKDSTCYTYGVYYASIDFYTMCGHNIIKYKRFKELISSPTITEHLIRDNKVIIKLSNGKVGIAKCSPEDEFDIYKGTTLALARAYGTSEETQKTISLEQKNRVLEQKLLNIKNIIGETK